jgi:hypothetical protein
MGYSLSSLNLDSPRFSQKLLKWLTVKSTSIEVPGPKRRKVAEVSEKAEGTKTALLRLAGTNERTNRKNLERY